MHTHEPAKTTKGLVTTLLLNLLFFFVELFAGLFSGSLALLSDAAHMLSDVLAIAVALIAHLCSEHNRKVGIDSKRVQLIGAGINAATLLFAGGFVVMEAAQRFLAGIMPVIGWPVLIVGVIGLVVNATSYWLLSKGDNGDLNIRSVIAHMWADALGSIGAIVASVFIIIGFPIADLLVAAAIAIFIFFSAIQIFFNIYKEVSKNEESK